MKIMTKIKNGDEINVAQTVSVVAICFIAFIGSAALIINAKSGINIFTVL